MSIVIPYTAEVNLLKLIVGFFANSNIVLHLFNNNITVDNNTTIGDFNEVPASTGYSAITLSGGSWTVATNSGISNASYSKQTFTFSGGGVTLYGYYAESNGNLVWCENFSPSISLVVGGTFDLTPSINLN